MKRSLSCRYAGLMSLVGLALTGCGEEQKIADVAAPVSRPALIQTLKPQGISQTHFTGTVRASERAELAFKLAGKLSRMTVQEGERVRKGQVLAQLDDAELKTALNSARVESAQAQADFDRGSKIFASSQAISRSDLDKLKLKRDLAVNKVDKAEQNLANATIKAPFDGVISQKLVNNFATVQPNQPVYVTHNPDQLEVVIHVPGKLFLNHRGAVKALAEINGLRNQKFNLSYRYYAADADPVSQTYQVVMGFDDKAASSLLPGMKARVFPVMDETQARQVMLVPIDVVVPSNTGSQFVWRVGDDGRVTKQPVTVGNVLGGQLEILTGLEAGDKIVMAGVHALAEGMQVHPLQPEESN